MKTSLDPVELSRYVEKQFASLFDDGADSGALPVQVSRALQRCEYCFSRVRAKYYFERGVAQFDHLHSDQYAAFLYFLSRSAFEAGVSVIAKKAYLLNKALHGLDVYYEVRLPAIVTFRHPVGTVLGRAEYADYLCVYQNCTVGVGLGGAIPRFQGPAVLFAGSHVIGNCEIGDNCWVSPGTTIMDETIVHDAIVSGTSPNLSIRPASRSVREVLFGAAV